MHPQQDATQSQANAQGPRLETILVSEVTLVPFPAGEYRIGIGGMEHPSKTVVGTSFPAVQVTVLPGCRQSARLDTADGTMAWLQRTGEQAVLSVVNPGGVVLFTTYRPSDYATTGLRMDIERLKQEPAQPKQPAQPAFNPAPAANPFAQPAPQPAAQSTFSLTPPGQPGFSGAMPTGFPQAPTQPAPQGLPPQGFQPQGNRPQSFQAPSFPGGFGLQPPAFGQPAPAFPGSLQAPGFGQAAPSFPGSQPNPAFGQPAPGGGFAQPGGGAPTAPKPAAPQQAPAAPAGNAPGIRIAAHIEREGDVAFEPGQPAGRPGAKRRLEALALYAEGVSLSDLEYAAVTYDGHLMPWVCPPQFTGTRGMGAPLIGFAARLAGDTAARYDIVYSGTFIQAGPVPAVRNGEFLKSPVQGDPLESVLVSLEPKA